MVGAFDQRDVHGSVAQGAGRFQAAEAAADDHHAGPVNAGGHGQGLCEAE